MASPSSHPISATVTSRVLAGLAVVSLLVGLVLIDMLSDGMSRQALALAFVAIACTLAVCSVLVRPSRATQTAWAAGYAAGQTDAAAGQPGLSVVRWQAPAS